MLRNKCHAYCLQSVVQYGGYERDNKKEEDADYKDDDIKSKYFLVLN